MSSFIYVTRTYALSSVPRVAPMAILNWKFMLKYFHSRKLNELLTRELYGIKKNLKLHKLKKYAIHEHIHK